MMHIENGWHIFREAMSKADMEPDNVEQVGSEVRVYTDNYSTSLFVLGLAETCQEVDDTMDLTWDLVRHMQVLGSTLIFANTDLGLDESKCGLCGEKADNEMGEFATEGMSSVYAHGQCGIDQGLELA